MNDNSSREYNNPKAYAFLIGAIVENNFPDLTLNGFTLADGKGAPSVTHYNGVLENFRYLRKDKKVQIEPYREDAPKIDQSKVSHDFIKTTTITEADVALSKIAIIDKAHLYLKIEGDDIKSTEEERANGVLKKVTFKLDSMHWFDPLEKMELRGWYGNGLTWAPERSPFLPYTIYRTKKKHQGLDLYAPVGTNTYACIEGEVYLKRSTDIYGNQIGIKGKYKEKTYYFFYAHLKDSALFNLGDFVKMGEKIGYTGKTGYENDPDRHAHLHFEVRNTSSFTGGRLNPVQTIPEIGKNLNINPEESDQP